MEKFITIWRFAKNWTKQGTFATVKLEYSTNAFATELVELGIELKDPNIGLIDFPTLVDGREAYLCWKLGEPEVGFWHELAAGVQGRQSVDDLKPQPRFSPTKT